MRKVKRQASNQEEVFQNMYQQNISVQNIYKFLQISMIKKHSLGNLKDMKTHLMKRKCMSNKYKK